MKEVDQRAPARMTHSWAAARPLQGQCGNNNPQRGGGGRLQPNPCSVVPPRLWRNTVSVSRCRCDGALLRGLRLRLGRGVLRERGERENIQCWDLLSALASHSVPVPLA